MTRGFRTVDLRKAAEAVGLIAVVLSLVFLGYELKKANDIAEAEAIASIMGEMNAFVAMYSSDDDLYRTWTDGLRDFDALNFEDRRRFRRLLNYAFNAYEIAMIYRKNGLVDDEYAAYFARDLCGVITANEGTKRLWSSMREARVAALVEFVAASCDFGIMDT